MRYSETYSGSTDGQSVSYTYETGYTDVTGAGNDGRLDTEDDITTRYVFDREGRSKSVYSFVANKMNNQINSVSPKYWGAFKELAKGVLKYGWNQMSNEILYWTGN